MVLHYLLRIKYFVLNRHKTLNLPLKYNILEIDLWIQILDIERIISNIHYRSKVCGQ